GLEQSVLSRVPGYALLKNIAQSLVGPEEGESCAVVLAKFGESWQIGLRMEGPTDGLVTVYIPGSPNPRSGSVRFISVDRIRPAGISLNAALGCLRQAGAGSGELLRSLSAGAASAKRES
ncbi:hypothetical protein JXA02_11905, partial [candidate division KSB1 bacterium]|nr:hypothetical protein [candidate division KSB1 bacterium]